jgi:hypothetical protein
MGPRASYEGVCAYCPSLSLSVYLWLCVHVSVWVPTYMYPPLHPPPHPPPQCECLGACGCLNVCVRVYLSLCVPRVSACLCLSVCVCHCRYMYSLMRRFWCVGACVRARVCACARVCARVGEWGACTGLVFTPLSQPYLHEYGEDWYNVRSVCACARECVPACLRACVRACQGMCVSVHGCGCACSVCVRVCVCARDVIYIHV